MERKVHRNGLKDKVSIHASDHETAGWPPLSSTSSLSHYVFNNEVKVKEGAQNEYEASNPVRIKWKV